MKCPKCDGLGEEITHVENSDTHFIVECSLCKRKGEIPDPEPTIDQCIATLNVLRNSGAKNADKLRNLVINKLTTAFIDKVEIKSKE